MDYMNFLEFHLGKIQGGWAKNEDKEKMPFKVVEYQRGPLPDTVTYSTIGLSKNYLNSSVSKKKIKHELFFLADKKFGEQNIPGILQQIGMMAYQNKRAFLRGEVIGPYGKLFKGTDMEALYVSSPVYFPESFKEYRDGKDIPIIQVWLFPITLNEANFIRQYEWEAFEDILVKKDPDLLNFNRKSII